MIIVKMANNPRNNPQYPGIGDSFEQIGNQFSGSVPHITLGKEGIGVNKPQNQQTNPNPYQQPQNAPRMPVNAPQQPNYPTHKPYSSSPDDTYENIRKWGLFIAVGAVLLYAAYRIILNLF